MRAFYLLLASLTLSLFQSLASPAYAQSTPVAQTPIFEVGFRYCPSLCILETTRIYADGRYITEGVNVELTRWRRERSFSFRLEKRLESEEVAELVRWAEQPDFLNARAEYLVRTVLHSNAFTIIYRNRGREQNIRVINYSQGNEAQRSIVPVHVLKLLQEIYPYYLESVSPSTGS